MSIAIETICAEIQEQCQGGASISDLISIVDRWLTEAGLVEVAELKSCGVTAIAAYGDKDGKSMPDRVIIKNDSTGGKCPYIPEPT